LMIVIITGANRGIGTHYVKILIEHHKKPTIILTSRNAELGQETLNYYYSLYPPESYRLAYHPLDITSVESVDVFIYWLKSHYTTFDILINNAAELGDRRDLDDVNWKMPLDQMKSVINTNFYSTVIFTEKMLPYLSKEGKILMISSNGGQLKYQGEPAQKSLSDENMTFDDLWKKVKEFEAKAVDYEHIGLGYGKPIYRCTKAFLNAYTRFILKKKLGNSQTCFNIHPGWIKTRMGGPKAELPIEACEPSLLRLLNMDLEESIKLNGAFFNQDGQLFEY